MPVVFSGEKQAHREGIPEPHQLALIARQLTKSEISASPEAKAAEAKEWQKLRDEDEGRGCWDESAVREYREVADEAKANGANVHFARLFSICSVKHWEMSDKRKWKARAVCQGNNVRDENGLAAMFAEAASSASHIAASKLLDAVAMLPGCAGEQSDAVSAYTQAKLYGDGRIGKNRDLV